MRNIRPNKHITKKQKISWNQHLKTASTRSTITPIKNILLFPLLIGHEGGHSLLLSEDGVVYFVGTARRGEDGDQTKTRRILKPSKPKVFNRMEGQFVSYVSFTSFIILIFISESSIFLFFTISVGT